MSETIMEKDKQLINLTEDVRALATKHETVQQAKITAENNLQKCIAGYREEVRGDLARYQEEVRGSI